MLIYLKEGEYWKLFCLNEGANILPWGKEGFIWETGVRGKMHRLAIKLTPRFSQNSKSTSHCLLLGVFIFYHRKIHLYEYVCKNFIEKLAIFLKCRESFNKILLPATLPTLPQEFFFCILRTVPKDLRSFSKFFQFISTSHSLPFKFTCNFRRYTKWKIPIFDAITRGNAANTTNGCQMTRYSHVEKDLNMTEYLNLNLE